MKHKSSQQLYEYWNRLRRDRIAPERSDIEPGDIRGVLGDTFILQANEENDVQFRLAGTRLCAAYGRELKGSDFLDLWTGEDRDAMSTLIDSVRDQATACVVGVAGSTLDGNSLPMELLLLPLLHQGQSSLRLLGAFSSWSHPFWIGDKPIVSQKISSMRLIWPTDTQTGLRKVAGEPTLVAARGQDKVKVVRHLMVFDGGKNV
jgi:hypothetical protein